MNCFMFPGQPFSAETVLPDDADFVEVVALIRHYGHFDPLCGSWLAARGTEAIRLQLLGITQSLYQLRKLREHGMCPGIIAQHSMGIYPALVACGSLDEAQAIEITWRVGSCLADMGASQRFALGCVTGLSLESLQSVAENNQVYVANHNTSRHFLLSGGKQEIDQALAEALAAGAFAAHSFDCDAPLHTPLVAAVEDELERIISHYHYLDPVFPLMNHLNQTFLGAAEMSGFLLRELQLPVYWERTYRALAGLGVTRFFEVGEGESLRKFNRWIDNDLNKEMMKYAGNVISMYGNECGEID